jgi:PAS domain S-box-containing protein
MKATLQSKFIPLILDSIQSGIFTIDAESRITSFNRAAEMMTGYSAQEAIGRRCYEIFRADICQQDCPLKRSVRTSEATQDRDITILCRDGSERPIAISTAALIDASGDVVGGVEIFRDLTQIVELRKKLESSYSFEDIISKNPAMQRLFERLPLYAASQSTILIEGESGTGKELVARALHNLSPRSKKPMVVVNCAALPDNLLESELFGYVRGAFTDAKKDKPGRFQLANGGTIFLDEIGEISPAMQVKLLRVLQEREFEPLGGTTSVKVNVRVIAATNKNLAEEVASRRFRDDLFYRLNVVRVFLPPLSDRREDIPLLANHFRECFNAVTGRRIERFSEKALAAMLSAPWPGNVRELENAVEHAFVICQGDTIHLSDLPHQLAVSSENIDSNSECQPARNPLDAAEADAILRALDRHHGNRTHAARELGISRNTLWRKIKRFNLTH